MKGCEINFISFRETKNPTFKIHLHVRFIRAFRLFLVVLPKACLPRSLKTHCEIGLVNYSYITYITALANASFMRFVKAEILLLNLNKSHHWCVPLPFRFYFRVNFKDQLYIELVSLLEYNNFSWNIKRTILMWNWKSKAKQVQSVVDLWVLCIDIESLQNRLLKVCYVPATSANLPRVSFFFSFLFLLLRPLTVPMKQTRSLKQSIFLDVYDFVVRCQECEMLSVWKDISAKWYLCK